MVKKLHGVFSFISFPIKNIPQSVIVITFGFTYLKKYIIKNKLEEEEEVKAWILSSQRSDAMGKQLFEDAVKSRQ